MRDKFPASGKPFLGPVNSRSPKRAGGRQKKRKNVKPQGSAARSGRRPKLDKDRPFKNNMGGLTGTKTIQASLTADRLGISNTVFCCKCS